MFDAYVKELRGIVSSVEAANDPAFGATALRLSEALDALDRAGRWLRSQLETSPDAALAGATPFLRMFGHAAGGALLAHEAILAARLGEEAGASARIADARFFAENIAVQTGGLATAVTEGAQTITGAEFSAS